ncbi:MAG: hypothetical protein CMP77_05065 [Flavobacterium sp.]|nr:hypothetical protein [Flavobacterium sp.]
MEIIYNITNLTMANKAETTKEITNSETVYELRKIKKRIRASVDVSGDENADKSIRAIDRAIKVLAEIGWVID